MASILAIDEYFQKYILSEKFIARVRKEKDPLEIFHSIQRGLETVGSFKADIYLFYVFILLYAQIINFYPSLAGETLGVFVRSNDYSILVLIAFDTLVGQFSKDRERMKKATEKLRQSLIEDRD